MCGSRRCSTHVLLYSCALLVNVLTGWCENKQPRFTLPETWPKFSTVLWFKFEISHIIIIIMRIIIIIMRIIIIIMRLNLDFCIHMNLSDDEITASSIIPWWNYRMTNCPWWNNHWMKLTNLELPNNKVIQKLELVFFILAFLGYPTLSKLIHCFRPKPS